MNPCFYVNTAFPPGNDGPKISMQGEERQWKGGSSVSELSASLSPSVSEKHEKQSVGML